MKENLFAKLQIRPRRIVMSAVVAIFMLLLTFYVGGGTKRLIICLGLATLSGILLLLPRLSNWITIPMLAAYLFYVPMKIFHRIELPVHDLSVLQDGAAELTALLIICVYLLIFLFTQNTAVALGVGSGFFLILFLVEYYIYKFRGDFLTPSDLKAIGTAVSVMNNYKYELSPEAVYSVIYFIFFIVLGSKIRIRMHKWVHVGVSATATLMIGVWYYVVMVTPNPLGKEFAVDFWNISNNRNISGACLSYLLLEKSSHIEVPNGYSKEAVETIAREVAEEYHAPQSKETQERPDIIMIMGESWSDLSVLGEFNTTKEYMPFTDGLTENTLRGNLYVSILGGLTANTEFEALTGNSLSLLYPGAVPYQNQVQHDMPSLARVLANQGYKTMAMHPAGGNAWSRNKVYSFFGFDEFIDQGNWEVACEYISRFVSDACNFAEIIHRYEERDPESPFFLFDVTIQNHGGYYGQCPVDVKIKDVGGILAKDVGYLYDVETYLSLIKISDAAFGELVAYFEQVDRPVIICLFGDHQPSLGTDFHEAVSTNQGLSDQEANLRKYIVPYTIWANYDVDWVQYGDMSANYLPAALLECSGLELPPFYQLLMELHEEYPVLTQRGCVDANGEMVDIGDISDTESILRYRMLEYNQLYEKQYQKWIFEGTGSIVK